MAFSEFSSMKLLLRVNQCWVLWGMWRSEKKIVSAFKDKKRFSLYQMSRKGDCGMTLWQWSLTSDKRQWALSSVHKFKKLDLPSIKMLHLGVVQKVFQWLSSSLLRSGSQSVPSNLPSIFLYQHKNSCTANDQSRIRCQSNQTIPVAHPISGHWVRHHKLCK